MIKLTRRTLLVGTSALMAAGTVSFRALAASRTYHALLVACTEYPNLPQRNWLIGPKNDAGLVHEYLLKNVPDPVRFAPENVTLLAKDVPGASGLPTHTAIKAALADLAAKVQRDDFVYLHLSGHGAQQPERVKGDETDGLDEIFLPVDIDKWINRDAGVPNALVDNEIGAALDAIRDKGAFVWAVFDCCHSGTATRAVEVDDEMERKVEFADLVGGDEAARAAAIKTYEDTVASASRGLDENGARKPAFNLTPTGGEPITKGKLVAFYAAQTVETTPEMPLPKGTADAPRFGLFTFTILSKLAENPNVTYRQLGQAVLQQYSADSRTRPTPLFEGELDARVFGTDKTDAVMQWPVVIKDGEATIGAGLLHRLTPGSKLAILPSALSSLSDAVGFLEVQSAKNLESRVKPVEFDNKPALKLTDIPANAYARVAEIAVDFKLVVARPAATKGLEKETALVNSVLDELAAAKETGFNIELVDAGKSAALRFAVMRENAIAGAAKDATDKPALWFLPASGDVTLKDGGKPPLIIIHMDDRQKLVDATTRNLRTIFRATGLSRLAAASDYKPEDVDVQFQVKRRDKDGLEPLQASVVPRVSPGDEVHVLAKNGSDQLVDINVLYVGSDYSITHIVAERLAPQATLEEGLLAFTDTSFGMERMIAVLTEAPPESEKEDLSFLAQDGVASKTRGLGPASFSDMLTDIGMAPPTRSVMRLADKSGPKGAVMIFPMETVPRA
ncbi:caspase family protein [Mesorhizobium qingshengii]|uniref:Caspase domain-containing protein n=1 Tax=Mesorhizobium qingshengii TaxID=1165689 RepID=A0A1G5ZED2_9HYPH|nr:caspase family protein [Mesorhizobium qingshengii]SDA93184.1 Caspase domain-containing protein [Mesorhizobium qingshengii]